MVIKNQKFKSITDFIIVGLLLAGVLYLAGRQGKLYFGADLQFHYNRMFEYYQNLRYGNLFPTISTYSANQIGSSVIAAYPPLPIFLGAMLFFVFPRVLAVYILLWLQFMIQFLISRFVASKVGLTSFESTIVGVLFVTATPLMTQSIQQWLMGEVWAMSFMPLVVLGAYRLSKNVFSGQKIKIDFSVIWPLVIGFTAILYCHILSFAIVFLYFLIYVSILFILGPKRKFVFWNVIISGIWTFFLTAPFLIPFLSINLNNKLSSPKALPELSTWAAPRITEIWEQAFEFQADTIGIVAILSVILGFFLFWKFNKKIKVAWLVSLFIIFSGTYYVWKYIYNSPLGVIQFPHRIFAIPIFLLTLLLVFECRTLYDSQQVKNIILVFLVIISITMLILGIKTHWLNLVKPNSVDLDYQPTISHKVPMTKPNYYFVKSDTSDNLTKYWDTYGAFDYLPVDTKVNKNLLTHKVEYLDGSVQQLDIKPLPNGIVFKNNFKSGTAVLPMIYYNARYTVTDQNHNRLTYTQNRNHQFEVQLKSNTTQVIIKRKHSVIELLSILIGILSFVISVIFVWYRYSKM